MVGYNLALINDESGKVYVLFKIALIFTAFLVSALIVQETFSVAVSLYYSATVDDVRQSAELADAFLSSIWAKAGITIAQNIVLILIAYLCYTRVDGKKSAVKGFGLKLKGDSIKLFCSGMLINAFFVLSFVSITILTGHMDILSVGLLHNPVSSIVLSIGLMLVVAMFIGFGEEILFRGYIQSELMGKFGAPAAIAIASFVFIAAHIFKLQLPLYYVSIYVVALLLGYLFFVTKSLYASIGFHFLEDFMVFQIFVSGEPVTGIVPVVPLSEPAMICLYGMEIGTWMDGIATVLGIVLLAGIYWYHRRVKVKPLQ